MRGAWIEIVKLIALGKFIKSRPMRGAWIEMEYLPLLLRLHHVAPHAGRVD